MIKNVYYEEIDPSVVTPDQAAEFYFHYNMIQLHPDFIDDYESFETKQLEMKNKIISNAIDRGDLSKQIRVDHSMIAISPIKNKVVMIVKL